MVYVYCLLVAVSFFCITLYCLKKRKIEFGFGLIWFGIGIFLFLIALRPTFLDIIAGWAGIAYSPSFLFACGIFFSLAVSYNLTLKVSEQKKKIITLTQELSILKNQLEKGSYGEMSGPEKASYGEMSGPGRGSNSEGSGPDEVASGLRAQD
ncbi:MAG: DUF2304 domain-containing protein [Peptococcaceae bacterium]|nr:DUF2304 domain-containing protein [Peptococcaceae bacterium]